VKWHTKAHNEMAAEIPASKVAPSEVPAAVTPEAEVPGTEVPMAEASLAEVPVEASVAELPAAEVAVEASVREVSATVLPAGVVSAAVPVPGMPAGEALAVVVSAAEAAVDDLRRIVHDWLASRQSARLFLILTAVGAAIFLGSEVLISTRSRVHYPAMELVYGAWLCVIPSLVVWFQRRWLLVHSELLATVRLRSSNVAHENWLSTRSSVIFAVTRPLPWVLIVVVTVLGTTTLYFQQSAYGDPVVDGVLLGVFGLVLASAGYGVYLLGVCLWCLRDLCNVVEQAPFFGLETRCIRRFESAWLLVGSVTGATYFVILGATVKSPYGIHGVFAIWMWMSAGLPLLCLLIVFVLLHRFRVTLKSEQLDRVAAAMQALTVRQGSLEDPAIVENLSGLAGIFERLQAVREWPISSSVAGSLVLAMIPIVGQALLSWKFGGHN
jgi:hypothetical protein